jgi:hypothetical protein
LNSVSYACKASAHTTGLLGRARAVFIRGIQGESNQSIRLFLLWASQNFSRACFFTAQPMKDTVGIYRKYALFMMSMLCRVCNFPSKLQEKKVKSEEENTLGRHTAQKFCTFLNFYFRHFFKTFFFWSAFCPSFPVSVRI